MTDKTTPVRPEALFGLRTGEGLTQQQLDGMACVECGVDERRVPSMVPAGYVANSGQVFRCADGCAPAAPELPPSVAWVDEMDADDASDFFDDVRRAAASYDLDGLSKALSTYWVIAMGDRAQQAAPGPETPPHGLPVVDQAAVTAALDGGA
jgi:hypothetical protein